MRRSYYSIADVWRSPWANAVMRPATPRGTDQVLRSTKLERQIYEELRREDEEMDTLEDAASKKLRTFPALFHDVFQACYSLLPKYTEEAELTPMAQKFNRRILDYVMDNEEYATVKSICEGRELPSYEAASEFITQTAGELDRLLSDLGGEKNALQTLEKLHKEQSEAAQSLQETLEQLRASDTPNKTLEQAALELANRAESKHRQVEAVSKLADTAATRHKDAIRACLSHSLQAASEKAQEARNILDAWGDAPGGGSRAAVDAELLHRVRCNPTLVEISRYLGRFREMLAQGRKNAYHYGRGEKYSLELGNDLSRSLTSELALLASPETTALFLRKYQQKQIKQYRRRERIYKGAGDIICCLDESGSTAGDRAAWGKAVALTLLEIAAEQGRSFALIHFSGAGSCVTDVFHPGQYSAEDKLIAAERFLDGGTDFETPLRSAVSLMEEGGFAKADVVFITDGCCKLPESYGEELRREQALHSFTVTGILLDTGGDAGDFSLQPFCRKIYRTSELLRDDIVQQLVQERV